MQTCVSQIDCLFSEALRTDLVSVSLVLQISPRIESCAGSSCRSEAPDGLCTMLNLPRELQTCPTPFPTSSLSVDDGSTVPSSVRLPRPSEPSQTRADLHLSLLRSIASLHATFHFCEWIFPSPCGDESLTSLPRSPFPSQTTSTEATTPSSGSSSFTSSSCTKLSSSSSRGSPSYVAFPLCRSFALEPDATSNGDLSLQGNYFIAFVRLSLVFSPLSAHLLTNSFYSTVRPDCVSSKIDFEALLEID